MGAMTAPSFLGPGWPVRARQALEHLREQTASPSHTGCAWCGVACSRHWHGWRYPWPDGTTAYLCDDCWRRYRSSRADRHGYWREQMAAEAAGLYLAPPGIALVAPFYEAAPPDRRGTGHRFSYLHDHQEVTP